MTKCITLNGQVINVGPWDFKEEKQTEMKFEADKDGVFDFREREVPVVTNPMPEGALEEDIVLAWTADGRIVRGDDPAAHSPYESP